MVAQAELQAAVAGLEAGNIRWRCSCGASWRNIDSVSAFRPSNAR